MRECYDEWERDPEHPLKSWHDAFAKQSFTPIGDTLPNGEPTYWPIVWPENPDQPGEGELLLSPKGSFYQMLGLLNSSISMLLMELEKELSPSSIAWPIRNALSAFSSLHSLTFDALLSRLNSPGVGCQPSIFRNLQKLAKPLSSTIEKSLLSLDQFYSPTRSVTGAIKLLHRSYLQTILQQSANGFFLATVFLEDLIKWFSLLCGDLLGQHPLLYRIGVLFDIGTAVMRGIINPKYGILQDWDLNRIDHLDFCEWLQENGMEKENANSAPIRTLYGMTFAYEDGDIHRPNFAAGTALRVFLRIATTYKGAVLYLPQMGFGESVIMPLYKVLKARGVKFHFFHKVSKLVLSEDQSYIREVHMERQVDLVDPSLPYNPECLIDKEHEPLDMWPATPNWAQIQDGEAIGQELKDAHMNLESKWCLRTCGNEILHFEKDFDNIVLGISLGGLKKFGEEEAICDELFEAHTPFRNSIRHIGVVPTLSVQLWSNQTLKELGWEAPSPAFVAGQEPLSIWAAMSQILRWEGSSDKAKSLHYLCGNIYSELYKRPASDIHTPREIKEKAQQAALLWMKKYANTLWPKATQADLPTRFDWDKLVADESFKGAERLFEQHILLNTNPSDCSVLGFKGTTRYRLRPDESGFSNLFLSGAWTRNGMNTSCVEAAVMSGKVCASAISRLPLSIVGNDFMQKP